MKIFSIGRMEGDVVVGIKNLLKNRIPNLKSLEISWFGGEPLIARKIVYDISRYAQSLSSIHKCEFYSNITSNGFLLQNDVARRLLEYGVKLFQISLDGTKDQHDKSRKLANGKGTFKVILDNLKNLKKIKIDYKVMIRIHYHPGNMNNISQLVRDLSAIFGDDDRFEFFLISGPFGWAKRLRNIFV